MWIYIKDRFNISNEAWRELATKTKQMPNNYKIPYYMKLSRHVNFAIWRVAYFATPYFRDFAKILHFDSL